MAAVDVTTEIEIDLPRDEVAKFGATPATPRAGTGFARVSAPIMGRAVRRANEAELRRLRQLLEA